MRYRQTGNTPPYMFMILGILSMVLGLAWMKSAIDGRLSMALTHAHFTQAVRTATKNIGTRQDTSSVTGTRSFTADGVPTTGGLPNNTGEWIALFSRITSTAPNGGPAYIVNRTGNANTGAIGISATNYGREVHISRPAYLGLNVQKIVVTPEDLFYEPPLDQLATR